MSRFRMMLSLGVLMAATAAPVAQAHPRLVSTTPERSAVLKTSPKEFRVTFSEAVIGPGSTFALTDSKGKAYPLGAAKGDPKSGATIIVPLPRALPAGAYVLRWDVFAEEHDSLPGLMRFDIRP